MLANDINFISLTDLKQVSPGIKLIFEMIPLFNMFLPSLWINNVAAAVEVKIDSDPHANSSKISLGISESKINLFSPFNSARSAIFGLNCLNKNPI